MCGLFCGWCRRDISGGSEVFLASIEFTKSGIMQCFRLEKSDKTVPSINSTMDLVTKKCGMELMFTLCSMNCGDRLLESIWKDSCRIPRFFQLFFSRYLHGNSTACRSHRLGDGN